MNKYGCTRVISKDIGKTTKIKREKSKYKNIKSSH